MQALKPDVIIILHPSSFKKILCMASKLVYSCRQIHNKPLLHEVTSHLNSLNSEHQLSQHDVILGKTPYIFCGWWFPNPAFIFFSNISQLYVIIFSYKGWFPNLDVKTEGLIKKTENSVSSEWKPRSHENVNITTQKRARPQLKGSIFPIFIYLQEVYLQPTDLEGWLVEYVLLMD